MRASRVLGLSVLLVSLMAAAPVMAEEAPPLQRPGASSPGGGLGVDATLVFLYYRDMDRAEAFYGGVLGLDLVVEQAFATIYQISPTSFVGLVDESRGMHRSSEAKPVTLSFITDEVDEWYEYLVSQGVEMRGPVRDSANHPTRNFVAYDPEGYYLEFETFLDDPENERLLRALDAVRR